MNRIDRFLLKGLRAVLEFFHLPLKAERERLFLQLIKFCLVGIMNTGISYGVYALLTAWGVYYLLSSVIAFIISTSNAYFWNNRYVFSGKDRWWVGLLKTFCAYGVTGVVLHTILLYILVDVCGLSKFLSPLLVLLVTIPLNFLLNKYWTYRRKEK